MISKKEVEHIAKLARLELTQEEIERFRKELSSILDYFKLLNEVDIDKVEPTSHPIEIENIMREDIGEAESSERIKKIIKQAPEKKEGYIKVKSIL